ncbi:MAG: hypothetical protein DMF21_10630 [Verrucomicrobia bacterium]|nr:MAG: hypothetical protein DMF21_10630 [Verrucomicrobiota bacterium]
MDQGDVVAALIGIRPYAITVWLADFGRLAEKCGDLFFAIAKARKSLAAQTGGEDGNQYQDSFHNHPLNLLDFEFAGRISRALRNNREALSI